MSRELMSLPIEKPTIRRSGATYTASSGSGTFHVLSFRTRTSAPVPTTRSAVALKNSSGRRAFRFLFPGNLAALVSYARGPHFLPVKGRQEIAVLNRKRRAALVDQALKHRNRVACVQHVAQTCRARALREIEDIDLAFADEADPGAAVVRSEFAQLHGSPPKCQRGDAGAVRAAPESAFAGSAIGPYGSNRVESQEIMPGVSLRPVASV
jgi:hypothetical protein